METLGYLLAAVTVLVIWDELHYDLIHSPKLKTLAKLLNRKPFSCGTCLAMWTGIVFFTCGFSIFFLSLPLLYKVITRIIEL